MSQDEKDFIQQHPELRRKAEELKGFEDILDILKGPRFSQKQNKLKEKSVERESFELLDLLETEDQRLRSLDHFTTKRLADLKEKGIVQKLAETQREKTDEIKELILKPSLAHTSPLYKNLELLFAESFSDVVPK